MVTIKLSDDEAGELFELLDKNKEQYPNLHERVYQAMTSELMIRIGCNKHKEE